MLTYFTLNMYSLNSLPHDQSKNCTIFFIQKLVENTVATMVSKYSTVGSPKGVRNLIEGGITKQHISKQPLILVDILVAFGLYFGCLFYATYVLNDKPVDSYGFAIRVIGNRDKYSDAN